MDKRRRGNLNLGAKKKVTCDTKRAPAQEKTTNLIQNCCSKNKRGLTFAQGGLVSSKGRNANRPVKRDLDRGAVIVGKKEDRWRDFAWIRRATPRELSMPKKAPDLVKTKNQKYCQSSLQHEGGSYLPDGLRIVKISADLPLY